MKRLLFSVIVSFSILTFMLAMACAEMSDIGDGKYRITETTYTDYDLKNKKDERHNKIEARDIMNTEIARLDAEIKEAELLGVKERISP